MTVRDLINELLQFDPSLRVCFLKYRKMKANEDLCFVDSSRYSDGFISIGLSGGEEEE